MFQVCCEVLILQKLTILIGFVPGIIWLLFWIRYRRHYPRTESNLIRVFVWGCASTIPTFIIEQITNAGIANKTLWAAAATSFFVIGPAEEIFKLLAVWFAIYRSLDFREPLDGLLYAATAALGFACVENAIYIIELGPGSIASRVFFATPAHILFSAMWGYALGIARFRLTGEMRIISAGVIAAAVAHGTYNFIIALYPQRAMVLLVPILVILVFIAYRLLIQLRGSKPLRDLETSVYISCEHCGAYNSEFAAVCMRCDGEMGLVSRQSRFCGNCRRRLEPDKTCASCVPQSVSEPIGLHGLQATKIVSDM